jgi:hypothetical protein
MKTLIVLIVVVGVGLVVLIVRSARERANRNHDPIEYYLGWGRYSHPISLEKRVTKEAAQAAAARGSAYLIAYFDADGQLTHVVKMLRGSVFFDFVYSYHRNGKLKTAKVTNADGVVTVWDYDESGRTNKPGFW